MSNNSPLVSHIDGFRRVWMFPRNIRKIHPAKISEILCLLQAESERSSWSGNQDLQNKFCKALELAGIKRPGDQYDSHSGGPRTYLAQLGFARLFQHFRCKSGASCTFLQEFLATCPAQLLERVFYCQA